MRANLLALVVVSLPLTAQADGPAREEAPAAAEAPARTGYRVAGWTLAGVAVAATTVAVIGFNRTHDLEVEATARAEEAGAIGDPCEELTGLA